MTRPRVLARAFIALTATVILPVVVIQVFWAMTLIAQDVRLAEFKGEITDMAGKPVAGAQVVATNVLNGKTYRFQTGVDGKFYALGVQVGTYHVVITGPTGLHIYSGKKQLFAGNAQAFNVIQIDLSVVPTKTSLVPFLGPKATDLQREKWRDVTEATLKDLTPEQRAELRTENNLIAQYNELAPQAHAALNAQDWSKAAELFAQLIAIAPYKWELYQNQGVIQRNLGQFQQAVQSFEKGIELVRNDPDLKQDRAKVKAAVSQMKMAEGEAYAALNNLAAAAEQYKAATQEGVNAAVAYIHLCVAEYNNGNNDSAMEACNRAIAIDPTRPEFFQTTAGIQSNLERYADAIQTYEKGIALAESTMRALSSIHSNINSKKSAEISGADVLQTKVAQMLLAEGSAYFHLKQYKRAAELFTRTARIHSYPALPLFNLCATYYDMNDLAAAEHACSQAIAADPKMPDSYYVKAIALYGEAARHSQFRTPRGFREALEKYLQLAPEGAYANDAKAMLKQVEGS